jgi:hypothetical protein
MFICATEWTIPKELVKMLKLGEVSKVFDVMAEAQHPFCK